MTRKEEQSMLNDNDLNGQELDIDILRSALIDYYGTAMGEFPMAVMDLERIRAMSDAEILEEARKTGLI